MTDEIHFDGTAISQYSRVEAGLAELTQKYGGVVYAVQTTEGMRQAKEARAAIREPRFEIERTRKALKEPVLKYGRMIDSEAKRITESLLAIEAPIDDQIGKEEARKEAERQAKIKAEEERVSAIHRRIDAMRPLVGAGVSAADIDNLIDSTRAVAIDDTFAEFQNLAQAAKEKALSDLAVLRENAAYREQEAARLAAERVELERLRAEAQERQRVEQEAARAEQARVAAEQASERQKLASERAALEAQKRAQEADEARKVAEAKAEAERAAEAQRVAQTRRPTDQEIAKAVAAHFNVTVTKAVEWLWDYGKEEA